MNIADSSMVPALNNATNQTLLAATPFNLTRQIELLATVISASGGATYSFGLFFGLAAALVAGSFILPIITGPILRLILQSIDKFRSRLRLLYPVVLSIYIVNVYVVIPFLILGFDFKTKILYDPYEDEAEREKAFDYYLTYIDLKLVALSFQLLLPAIAFFSIFQGRGPFRWFKGRGKRSIRGIAKRFLFVIFSLSCALFPFLFFYYNLYPVRVPNIWAIPIGILPVIFLLWIWYGSPIREFCKRKCYIVWRRKSE